MGRQNRLHRILFPDHILLAAIVAIVYSAILGAAGAALGVLAFGDYGWSVFLGLPILQGGVLVLVYGFHQRRRFDHFLLISVIAVLLMFCILLLVAFDGLVCLLIAAPLWWIGVLIGMGLAYPLHVAAWRKSTARGFEVIVLAAICFMIPTLMGAEALWPSEPEVVEVTTTMDVDAPPEAVWPLVAACGEVRGELAWPFRLGIAYPVATRIEGAGIGARRLCVLSTGPMMESVTVWEPNQRLRFSVTQMPEVMRETSPWGDIHPPHLEGIFVVREGQFELIPLPGPGGRVTTRIVGRSWYTNRMGPSWYWRMWCNLIVHDVHERVLMHIKGVAEKRILPG
jgi:hypothetical protein